MKDQVATEVAAAAHLARSGWRPERGELKVIVAADEELRRPPRRPLAVRGASRQGATPTSS